MNAPELKEPQQVAEDVFALESYMPVPGFGILPVNSFVIKSKEPLLIDTGLAGLRADYLAGLGKIIDPADLRWIWITHTDADHVGNLTEVLKLAPEARVITTYLGMGKMNMLGIGLDRVYLLNPGQNLDAGNRKLTAITPPTFDAPETTGLFDRSAGILFSADCFGALLQQPAESAAAIGEKQLRDGMVMWTTVDSPWLSLVDETHFKNTVKKLGDLKPRLVLSSHLPPANGMLDNLIEGLHSARTAPPFTGPDQAALEAMMSAAN